MMAPMDPCLLTHVLIFLNVVRCGSITADQSHHANPLVERSICMRKPIALR
jgi:hypothetical protein